LKRVVLERFPKRTLLAVLLCFVALVGAVGAYAFVSNNQTSAESPRRAVSNGYVLKIDKTVYKLGEEVKITFTNNSPKTITFCNPGWDIITNSEGRQVWPSGVVLVTFPVPPGKTLTDYWPQIDQSSEVMVPPGIYTVKLCPTTTPPIAELEELSLSFEIVD